jgi:hypothetical protein
MADNFLAGFEGGLYVGDDTMDWKLGVAGKVGEKDANDIVWTEIIFIQDVSQSNRTDTADLTTREIARAGFSAEIDILKTGEITVPFVLKPGNAAAVAQARDFILADQAKTPRSILRLSQTMDSYNEVGVVNVGALGVVANCTVTVGAEEPVKGVQTLPLTFKFVDYVDVVEVIDDGGAKLQKVS